MSIPIKIKTAGIIFSINSMIRNNTPSAVNTITPPSKNLGSKSYRKKLRFSITTSFLEVTTGIYKCNNCGTYTNTKSGHSESKSTHPIHFHFNSLIHDGLSTHSSMQTEVSPEWTKQQASTSGWTTRLEVQTKESSSPMWVIEQQVRWECQ